MHSICYGRKRWRVFAVYPLNSVVMLSYLAGSDQKLMVSYTLHSILYIHLPPTEIRRHDVILQYAADRSRHTKDCVLQSATFQHYLLTEKHRQGLFMILHYSFLRARDIAQILKRHRRV